MAETAYDNLKLEMDKAKLATATSQLAVMKSFKESVKDQLHNGFNDVIKSNREKFAFNDLQKNIGNIFKNNTKTFTNFSDKFSEKIASLPSKIGTAFSKFNPFSKISANINKTKDKIKKFVGRDTETLKAKYYENWWNPERVAIRQQRALQNFWKKQLKKEEKKVEKTGVPSYNTPSITQGQLLGTIAK